MRCGKEMGNTTGGNYNCPHCGFSVNDLVYRSNACDLPIPQGFGELKGWTCPVCGRGLAPWMSMCPCMNKGLEITYETKTLEQLWNGVDIVGKDTDSKNRW